MINTEKIDLNWAREHLRGFAGMQDTALAVKADEAEYAKLKTISEEKKAPDGSRLPHPLSPFRVAQGVSHVEQSPVCGVRELTSESLGDELLDTPE